MKKLTLFLICAALLLIAGCQQAPVASEPEQTQPQTQETAAQYIPAEANELFSDRDYETLYNENSCIPILLQGDSVSGSGFTLDGTTVTISQEGAYLISGTLNDGMIIVDCEKDCKLQLILNNTSIHSQTCAPIYIRQADKVFITLSQGSTNTLSCGEGYTAIDDSNIDSVIFSKEDLTLNGSGALSIHSPTGHGIVSKDDLRITGGSYNVTAAGHGLSAKDSLRIDGGSYDITSGKDGIHCENSEDSSMGSVYILDGDFQINAQSDGISGESYLQITGGEYDLTCGGGSQNAQPHSNDMFGGGGMGGRPGQMGPGGFGGSQYTETEAEDTVSAKAVKSNGNMVINGGAFQINSADDALHSNASMDISGGEFQIATGDDGFHADDALTVTGGAITVTQSYEGMEGLTIVISGGDISLKASDDGLNAAGGNDQSGFGGMGGPPGGGKGGNMWYFEGDTFESDSECYIEISGGKLYINADGDGIDSNGDLSISGGDIVVEGPTGNGNGALDYGGAGAISGGTAIISGSSGMAQSLNSAGEQGVIALNTGSCSPGTAVTVTDSNGNVIIEAAPDKQYSCIIVSCPEIQIGESYTVTVGEQSETFIAQ